MYTCTTTKQRRRVFAGAFLWRVYEGIFQLVSVPSVGFKLETFFCSTLNFLTKLHNFQIYISSLCIFHNDEAHKTCVRLSPQQWAFFYTFLGESFSITIFLSLMMRFIFSFARFHLPSTVMYKCYNLYSHIHTHI